MIGIRLHGRGGQGAVVASKILANAYFSRDFYVQAFPSFGMERKGAAVAAFVRRDRAPIIARGEITAPDTVVVLDPTLLQMIDVTHGLTPGGLVLLNWSGPVDPAPLEGDFRLAAVNAARIALDFGLGSRLSPIVNTVILGALAMADPDLELDALLAAIRNGVPVKPEENAAAARAAFEAATWIKGD